MKLSLLATAVLAVPLVLTTTVRAQNTVPQQPLPMVQPPASATQMSWQEFSSQPGGFAVLMPGAPKEETETEEDGSLSRSFTLQHEASGGVYLVSYYDKAGIEQASPAEIEALLDQLPGEFAKGGNAKLVRSQTIVLNGNPGREFEFAIDDGIVGKGRLYLVQQRLFLVVGVTPEIQDRERFLDSFRLF